MSGDVAIDPQRFREVLGHLPSGVTVITAHGPGGPAGVTCNSFTSASLDPPLVAVFPAKSSSTWPTIREAGHFCVNVMASHHEQTTRQFARRGVDRFAGVDHHARPGGPAIADAVAWIDCRIVAEHEAGDHTVVLAEVIDLDASAGAQALVFWHGAYASARRPSET